MSAHVVVVPRHSRLAASPLTAALLTLLCFTGCGGDDASRVSGVVKLAGAPVGPGSLVFEPADLSSSIAPSGVGEFGEDGAYKLRGPANRDNVPPGEYIVTVQGNAPGMAGDENSDPTFDTAIPDRYKTRDNGIKVTVKPGDNSIDLNLEP